MKAITTYLLLLFPGLIFGQKNSTIMDSFRTEKGKFGYNTGINYSMMQVSKPYVFTGDSDGFQQKKYAPQPSFGFSFGILHHYEINNKTTIRAESDFTFNNGHYSNVEKNERDNKQMKLTAFELPAYITFKPFDRKNSPYFVTGGKMIFYTRNLQQQGSSYPKLNKKDLAIDFGFGCPINFLFFRIIPEIRFSFGLLNLFKESQKEKYLVSSVTRNTISLVINSY